MRVAVTLDIDLDCDDLEEIGGRVELREHIQSQVGITGHLWPEHPLFRAFKKVSVRSIILPRKALRIKD